MDSQKNRELAIAVVALIVNLLGLVAQIVNIAIILL